MLLTSVIFIVLSVCPLVNGISNFPIPVLPEVLFTSGVEVGPPMNGTCSDPLLNSCQLNFNEILGLSNLLDWHTPQLLLAAIQEIYIQQGVMGHIMVCHAYQAYRQCLGSTYQNCVSPYHLIGHGYSPSNSFFFAAIFGQLDFQCGGGFNDFIGNYQCINATAGANVPHTSGCYAAYQNGLASNPSSVCRLTNTLMACVRQPFAIACDPAASWFSCEYIRRSLFLPSCHLRCYVGRLPSEKETAPEQQTSDHVSNLKKVPMFGIAAALEASAKGRVNKNMQ